MSTPYIKREDDDGGGNYSNYPYSNVKSEPQDIANNRLLSREVLTRGFNSFDDTSANQATSMIDESDLLDLESIGSPDAHNYGNGGYNNNNLINQSGRGFVNNSGTSAPRDFSRATQQSYNNKILGTTPPIPESTSPFDNFLLNQARFRGNPSPNHGNITTSTRPAQPQQPSSAQQQQQPHQPQQTHQRSQSQSHTQPFQRHNVYPSNTSNQLPFTSPRPESHIDRFMHENAIINSNSSTPVGSYDGNYSTSPGVTLTGGGGFSLPNYPGVRPSINIPSQSVGKSSTILTSDEKQQQLLERRRRRRESHNAVERRRRDNINEKIKELSELIPEKFLLAGMEQQLLQKGSDDRPNKGTVLGRSVDYIRQLQQIIDEQNRAELDLQDLVNSLQKSLGIEVTEYRYTSAELALSRLGIGPQISGATPPVVLGTGSGPDDLKSPISNSSQSSRPTTNAGSVPPSGVNESSNNLNSITSANSSNIITNISSNTNPNPPTSNSSTNQPHATSSSNNNNRSSDDTPEFTPEFYLDFYQKQGYAPQDESAIFDDDYGYSR